MYRYFIQLAYKGSAYSGWQIQENTQHTVQQRLNKALSLLFGEELEAVGCGRTDTGVHAEIFYAHFDTTQEGLEKRASHWIYKLNLLLPTDIAVFDFFPVSVNTHARFSALSRTYEYRIHRKKNPFLTEQSHYYYGPLDILLMNAASRLLLEREDFACFCKGGSDNEHYLCNVYKAEWELQDDVLIFTIRANRFLRNMVRAIVGTLLEVGKGKISLEEFAAILQKKNRSDAGPSAPACGLYLTQVDYPEGVVGCRL
jgi:tRNA pseudouridine38-40 synthase